MAAALRERLDRLHALILRERECAKALALDEMLAVTREKEDLLQGLEPAEGLEPQDRELVRRIREENRRNAYLFWSTLNWIRETMEFFGRQSAPSAYSPCGSLVRGGGGGNLLSGKV